MEIGDWIIERAFQVECMVAAALVSGYWFHRACRRFKGRLRYTRAQREEIREKARRGL